MAGFNGADLLLQENPAELPSYPVSTHPLGLVRAYGDGDTILGQLHLAVSSPWSGR